MQIEKITCPSCGSGIDNDLRDKKVVFCPYCGSQLSVDFGDRTITKNINIHKRFTDDAAVERARNVDRENERNHKDERWVLKSACILMFICIMIPLAMMWGYNLSDKMAVKSGKIQVGISASDMEGKKYKGIEEQLRAAGFTNIVTIDLDDQSIIKFNNDKIDSVTIDGKKYFSASDYFYPDAKVIISYH